MSAMGGGSKMIYYWTYASDNPGLGGNKTLKFEGSGSKISS